LDWTPRSVDSYIERVRRKVEQQEENKLMMDKFKRLAMKADSKEKQIQLREWQDK
jgi:hypothetical protein